MREEKTCPRCGSPLPADAPAGNCPSCLVNIALAAPGPDPLVAPGEASARTFGDYELLERLGSGGMGVIYRARQVSLNRPVALKLIRSGQFASPQEIARFKMEAEAVGSLDHPNIVSVYEVGSFEDGHFLSMKLVSGHSLEQEKSRYQQDPRAMATLLAKGARAVHHAHQRGILHRDLKPSNILIDEAGEPQVTDFGLAKRIGQDQGMTQTGQMVGTPAYMAPEQARAGAKGLTTAADVYGLGVILYELLTGDVPFKGATPMETLRQAAEQEPKPPSSIHRRVDRDLETICLRCLEKEPGRRYASAEGLAEELERWLRHEPIFARRTSAWMRGAKWARRRPAVAVAIALLIAGTCVSTWQAVRARQAERQAKHEGTKQIKMAEFLLGVLRGIKPSVAAGRDTTMLREMLERAQSALGPELRGLPDIQAHLLLNMAGIYNDLGDHRKAVALNREALNLFRAEYGPEHTNVIQCLNNLGLALGALGDAEAGEKANREALALCKKLLGNDHPQTVVALQNLGAVLYERGDFRGAEQVTLEALPVVRKIYGETSHEVAVALGNLAAFQERLNDLAGAESANRQSIAILEKLHGRLNPSLAIRLRNLSLVLQRQGKLAEAEALTRESLETTRKLYGEEHAEVAEALYRVAEVVRAQGKLDEAESTHRKALAMRKAALGDEHPTVSHYCARLAEVLQSRGELTESESLARQALEIRRKTYGQTHRWVAESLRLLASILRQQGRQAEADPLQTEADQIQQRLKAK
jgi:eukaryotic-like serine/threonine-protein kinase